VLGGNPVPITAMGRLDAPGSVLDVAWTADAQPDPDEDEIRFVTDATPVFKAEGIWWGNRSIWFMSSFALGPGVEDPEDVPTGARRPDLALRRTPPADRAGRPVRCGRTLRRSGQHHGVTVRLRRRLHRWRGRPVAGRDHRGRRGVPVRLQPAQRQRVHRGRVRTRRPDPVRQPPGAAPHLRHTVPGARSAAGAESGRDGPGGDERHVELELDFVVEDDAAAEHWCVPDDVPPRPVQLARHLEPQP
jgi:hypothetical protein